MKAFFRSKNLLCLIMVVALLISLFPLSRVNSAEPPQTDPTRNIIMAGWNKAALIYNNSVYEWNKGAPVPTLSVKPYISANELGFRELDYMIAETGTSLGATSSFYATLSGGVITLGGANRYGQRGDTAPYQNNYEDPTTNILPIPTNVVQMGVGGYHMIVMDASGKVWSWGRNNYGQLGNGSNITSEYEYGLANGGFRGIRTPTIINALLGKTITYIAAGDNCNFVVDSLDNVYSWGFNRFGQLGLGDTIDRYTPTLIPELSGKRVIKIMSGMSHTIALTADGRIYAWGDNSVGELGLGYFNIGEPMVKTPTLVEYLTNVKNIGKGTSSSYAVTEDGRYWGWGRNEEKIVDASGEQRSIPVHIFPASIYKSSISTISEGSTETRYIYLRLLKDSASSFNNIQPQNTDFTFNSGSYGTYTVNRAWKLNEYECILAVTYPLSNQDINYNISLTMNGRLFKNNLNRVIPYWGQAPYANQLPGQPVSETDPGIEKWRYLPQRFVEGSPSIMTLDYNISGASFTAGCTPANIRLGQSLLRGFTIKNVTLLNGNQTARLVIEYDGSDNDNINSGNGLDINLRDEIPLIYNSSTNSLGLELNTTAFRYFAVDNRVSLGISSDNLEGYFIPENAENGRYIIVSLVGSTFKENISASAFTFSNLPEGVTIDYSKTVRVDNNNIKFHIQGNRTKDYDADIINTSVSCPTSQIIEDNSTILTADTGLVFKATKDSESITIKNDPGTNGGVINEGSEDGSAILVTLSGGTFASAINNNNWTVLNLPQGVNVGSVQRVDDTHVKILLLGNRNSDYDSNITNVTVTCTTAEYNDSTDGASLTTNTGAGLIADNDVEVLTIGNNPYVNGGRIYEGREDGTEIIATINGGAFVNPVNILSWTVTNLPSGVNTGNIIRIDDTHVKITLSGNSLVDYTGDINNVTVACKADQYVDSTGSVALTAATGVILRKNPLSIVINNSTDNIYINGSGTISTTGTYGNTDNTDTTISATIDGKTKSSILSESGSIWQLDWNIASLGIREGNFKDLAVSTTDSYGNFKTATYTGDLVVDATAPDTTITNSPVAFTNYTTASFSFVSNDVSATFEGSLDDAPYSTYESPVSFVELAGGPHIVSIRAKDAVGNIDLTPATFEWTVDTIAPETIISSMPDALTNSTSASFTFVSDDGSATFEGSLDGAAYSKCTSPVTFTGLTSGSHTLSIRAIDAAGNMDSTYATFEWTVDTTGPDTTITSSPDPLTNATSGSFTFASDDSSATFECSLDGTAYILCTSPITFTGLESGSHTLSIRAIDLAGNMDLTPANYTWTVDTTTPKVLGTLILPENRIYKLGDALNITVPFTENVILLGEDSTLGLTVGTTVTNAVYYSSTSDSITYSYIVRAGDLDMDGIIIGSIVLNNTTIRDVVGNDADLTLSGNNLDTSGIKVSGIAPVVSSVVLPGNGYYKAGSVLTFTINFSENVTVIDETYLPLSIGSIFTNAVYSDGSGSSTLSYNYIVQQGNLGSDIVIGASILLNGGTIRSDSGNDAVLTLNSIGNTTGIIIDGVAPTVDSANNLTTYTVLDHLIMVKITEAGGIEAGAGYSAVDVGRIIVKSGASNHLLTPGQSSAVITDSSTVKVTIGGSDLALIQTFPGGERIDAVDVLNGGIIDVAGNANADDLNNIVITRGLSEIALDKASLAILYAVGDSSNSVTKDLDLPVNGVTGTTISWSSSNTNVISANGTVYRTPDTTSDINVTLTATISLYGISEAIQYDLTVKKYILSDMEAVTIDAEALQLFAPGESESHVTANLNLPAFGQNGTIIIWNSNRTDVISVTGEVYRSPYTLGDQLVTVTATVYRNDASVNRMFNLNVIKQPQSPDEAVDQDLASITIGYTTGDSQSTVTQNITFPTAGSNGTTITWSSNNPAIISNAGVVTRLPYVLGDSSVTVTASVYMPGAVEKTRTFTLTVLMLPPSKDASLIQLSVEGATMTPEFNRYIASYSSSVQNSISSIIINSVSADTNSIIKVDGNIIAGNSITAGLSVGSNTITIEVIAQDGTTKKLYTLNITRAAAGTSDEGGNDTAPATNIDGSFIEISVNGQTQQTAAKLTKSTEGSMTVETVSLDSGKIEERINKEGRNAVITIPVNTTADIVRGELNGLLVKAMESKEATVEIRTLNGTYILPSSQINIDSISAQLGAQQQLQEIKVSIEIANTSAAAVKLVNDIAKKGNFTIVVPPVEFTITCTYGDKTIEVIRFNSYVERMIPIPEGIDPQKISTGVVLNPDGTLSHVPTRVKVIDGKYYAIINSLTNSTYFVIWNPKVFDDMENHWSKENVNEMGSRLIINGEGENTFAPDRNVTRAEFTAIIIRALGIRDNRKTDKFNDIKEGDWYMGAIASAIEYGIVDGYVDGSFKPNSAISREEAMVITARAMNIAGIDSNISGYEAKELLDKFNDDVNVSDWANKYAAACIKSGLIEGNNGLLAPKDNITRAETATIVTRLLKKANLI